MWSDLDRSTVWDDTAGSSQFLHMGLTRDIDAADEAIRCGCHLSNSSMRASVRSAWWRADVSRWRCEVRPNGSSHGRVREMTPTSDGFIRRIYITRQCHVKESTRSGRLSPHSAPIEVGPHPRRLPRCPLESSNGAPHRMRSQRRSLSFIGEAPAAQLRRRMTTDPYVTTHFFQALTLNSPWCSLLHDGGGMTRTDPSTPPAAPAALGDGCARTDSSGRGSAGPPLARIAQLRHGCCPPPASLTPLACGCCKPPLNRAS